MVSVGRGMAQSPISALPEKNTFYDELIDLAGGVNAITAATIQFPWSLRRGFIESIRRSSSICT